MIDSKLRTDLALLGIRAMVGAVFVFHGAQKLFGAFGGYGLEGTAGWMASIGIPFADVSAFLAGSTEFFGGLALIAGLATRLVSVPLLFTMLVASFTAHTGFNAATGGMEYPLTLAVIAAALSLTGAGRFAVDARIPYARILPGRSGTGSPALELQGAEA